jgi:hypothetical protein
VLKTLIKRAVRFAGLEMFRADSDDFRWSHTVEDYYPVAPKPRWHSGKTPHSQLYRIIDRNRTEYQEAK